MFLMENSVVLSQTGMFLCVLSSRGGCVLTDQQPPGSSSWLDDPQRPTEGVVKEGRVWARLQVGGAGDGGGRAEVAGLLRISKGN